MRDLGRARDMGTDGVGGIGGVGGVVGGVGGVGESRKVRFLEA